MIVGSDIAAILHKLVSSDDPQLARDQLTALPADSVIAFYRMQTIGTVRSWRMDHVVRTFSTVGAAVAGANNGVSGPWQRFNSILNMYDINNLSFLGEDFVYPPPAGMDQKRKVIVVSNMQLWRLDLCSVIIHTQT